MQNKVLLVGHGAMGSALAAVWKKKHKLTVVDPLQDGCLKSINDVRENYCPEVVVLAVDPDTITDVMTHYSTRFDDPCTLWVSVVPGIPLSFFRPYFKSGQTVIRVMSNLPARFQKGISGMVSSHIHAALAEDLFSAVGEIIWLQNEAQIDAMTAIAGSGLAYFYLMVEELEKIAVELGIPVDIAGLLVRQTAIGVGAILDNTIDSPEVLRQQVTSQNGTTAAAVSVLMNGSSHNLGKSLQAASRAARDLSVQMAQSA